MIARSLATTLAAAAALAIPAAAQADGLPVPVDDGGPHGVLSANGAMRWVTTTAARGTVVERLNAHSATIIRSAYLRGHFTIPVVALDGTTAGLSHDGRTLVLIKPRASFPRKRTQLTILDAATLRARPFTLRGDFSFDAVSPDGRTLYLIQYVDPTDPTKYNVRALDARTERLQPKPIVDPNEHGDEMNGYPATRAVSADGRWHYTLYARMDGQAFVHALDSQQRHARCIDLPLNPDRTDVYSLHLRMGGGGTMQVVGKQGRALLNVDTASFAVTRPAATGTGSKHDDGGLPSPAWAALVALLLVSAGAAVSVGRRRQLARR
jgi:hypothetical protein